MKSIRTLIVFLITASAFSFIFAQDPTPTPDETPNVSDKFIMSVPLYADFGKGWVKLGAAKIVGNNSVEINGVQLPAKPKKVVVAALQDVLTEKISDKKL